MDHTDNSRYDPWVRSVVQRVLLHHYMGIIQYKDVMRITPARMSAPVFYFI
jgi:hypothetical protein